jgi:hypothetical protein
MKTFKDLKFKDHEMKGYGNFNTHALIEFDNGYGVSVITGGYGSIESPYELAICLDGNLCYDTYITDDVLGYLTEDGVSNAMDKVQKLTKK